MWASRGQPEARHGASSPLRIVNNRSYGGNTDQQSVATASTSTSMDSVTASGGTAEPFVLGHYKRHGASGLGAAPLRGSNLDSLQQQRRIGFYVSDERSEDTFGTTKHYAHDVHPPCNLLSSCYLKDKGIIPHMHRWRRNARQWLYAAVVDNRLELACWTCLAFCIYLGYRFFSDGGFSAILTLASAFQCFSLALLHAKVYTQRSVVGISQRSLCLIMISLVFRLASTLFYNGYLPVDRSGDWVYQCTDICAALLTALLIVAMRWATRKSAQAHVLEKDTCWIGIPLACVGVLAVLIHPNLNQNVIADTCWTFSLYVETFSMVPQLFMMGKTGGEVEGLTSHYVASMAASKVLAFLFWYFSFTELSPRTGGRNIAGWAVMLSYSGQTLLFLDFMYYYVRSMRVGKAMVIQV